MLLLLLLLPPTRDSQHALLKFLPGC